MQHATLSEPADRAPRIVVLSHSTGWGGAERAAVTLAGYWAECGAEVTLLAGTRDGGDSGDFYNIPDGVDCRTLAFNYEVRGFKKLWEEGRRIRLLMAEIGATNADIVIGSSTAMAMRVALARLFGRGRFLAVGWEHTNYLNIQSRAHQVIRRVLYRCLDRLVLLTERDQDRYRGISKSVVIENAPGVDGEAVEKPRNFSFTVMAVGRLVDVKGFDLLLAVAKEVNRTDQRIQFNIYGDGENRPALEAQIAALGLQQVVRLCGQTRDIEAAYEASELFVLTSRFEGFPLAMLEAMSFGLPVVAFDCPTGPREILGDQSDSGLVPAGDTQACAEMIVKVIEEQELYDRLSRQNAAIVGRYRLPEVAKKWDRFLGLSLSAQKEDRRHVDAAVLAPAARSYP